MMTILATKQYFYTHGFEGWLIIGLLCVALGLLVGWLAWRHCQAQADRVERMNDSLRQRYKSLKADQGKLDRLFEDLS